MKSTLAQVTASRILLVVAGLFVGVVISMSVFIIVQGFRSNTVQPAQAQAMFTSFAHKYIGELSPRKATAGSFWQVRDIRFVSNSFATVIASDGTTTTTLNVVFAVEPPNVRVYTVVDATPYDWRDAELTLVQFLQSLAQGRYADAARMFNGDMNRLREKAQRTDGDVTLLLSEYCMQSPLRKCLPFIITKREAQGMEYTFSVTYFDDANEKVRISNRDSFDLTVLNDGAGSYSVRSLPFDTVPAPAVQR